MKKNILILLGVLFGVYLVLTMIDTSEYRVEKKIFRLQKSFLSIAEDPKAVPEAQFERVVAKYRKLIKKYPKSRYAPQMYSNIGTLYVMNKDYEKARQAYGEAVVKFSDSLDVVSKALLDIGNTYMFEKNIKQAVDVYQRIWDDYGRTEVGFKMPLFLAGLYKNAGDQGKVRHYLSKAEVFYKDIASDVEDLDMVRINADQALASVYIAQERWQDAINVLKGVLYDYADSRLITGQRLSAMTRAINMVCIGRLQDFDQAIDIYESFLEDHPGHYLNPFLQKVIKSVDMLKEYNLKPVSPSQ